jgi:dipeptidyl-peptidase III
VNSTFLQKLVSRNSLLSKLFRQLSASISTRPSFSLGYPSNFTQSSYYPGTAVTERDIAVVSKVLEQNSIFLENTRLRKVANTDYEVLLASVQMQGHKDPREFSFPDGKRVVKLVHGDYSSYLERICAELSEASKYTANHLQRDFLMAYIESFQTGSSDSYRTSQRIWVQDKAPRVENIIGFVV